MILESITSLTETCRLPDEDAGEVPAACIVMNKSAKESEEDIMSYVSSNVASYKRVRVVQFVDSIPKSASGKIMRRFLKESAVKWQAKTSDRKNIIEY